MAIATASGTGVERGGSRLPPGPPAHWLLGHSRAFQRDALGVLLDGARAFGDVVAFRFGPVRACLLAHPDHVQHVLQKNHRNYNKDAFSYRRLKPLLGEGMITADGSAWQTRRALAQPAFQRSQLESVAQASLRAAEAISRHWRMRAAEGRPTDVHRDMMGAALEVAAKVLFDASMRTEARPVGEALDIALSETLRRVYALLPLPLFVPTNANRRFQHALSRLHGLIEQIIARRRASSDSPHDLLHALMAGLDGRQLRDEAITLLLAGHETTANALVWTFWLLGQHRDVAARLRAEIDSALGGRPPILDDLPRLLYVRMVLEEAMRLYPPVWVVDRNTVADDVVGGYRMRAGTLVMLSQYVTHRHPAFWPDPERFDPERFAPAAAKTRPRYAYFPFAGGPRMCIGAQFAMTEATLILACLASRFELTPLPGHAVEPNPSVTLRPRNGAPMRVTVLS